MKKLKKLTSLTLSILFLILAAIPLTAHADAQSGTRYVISDRLMTTQLDNGFSSPSALSVDDPLLGVNVVDIVITGFSAVEKQNGSTVFLKSNPDVPSLSLELRTDLQNIGGTGAVISNDSITRVADCGYVGDSIKTGLLWLEHVDARGQSHSYFLTDVFNTSQRTIEDALHNTVWFGKEGDYTVGLYFETRRVVGQERSWVNPFKYVWKDVYGYNNYVLKASFSVVNANTMAFLFNEDGKELYNGDVTDSFVIDLANNKNLSIYIKREIEVTPNRLGEDTDVRFNTVAVEGRVYSAKGIYSITAKNKTTGQTTVKRILIADSSDTELLQLAAASYPAEFYDVEERVDSSFGAWGVVLIMIALLIAGGAIFLYLRRSGTRHFGSSCRSLTPIVARNSSFVKNFQVHTDQ